MKLTKIIRIAAVGLVAAMGFTSMAQAAVDSVYFSAAANCVTPVGAATMTFSPGGPAKQVHLCMTTSAIKTCGFTAVLQSAALEGGRFQLTTLDLGPNYSDPTWSPAAKPVPLPINNPPQFVDLGGTSGTDTTVVEIPAAANQLLASFSFAPQVSATNSAYTISLASVSSVAVSTDNSCGGSGDVSEVPIAASVIMNRDPAPVFTSSNAVTFSSSTSSNTFDITATGTPAPTISLSSGTPPSGLTFTPSAGKLVMAGMPSSNGTFVLQFTANNGTSVIQTFTLNVNTTQASQTITFPNPGNQFFSSTLIPVTAVASSMLPITFSTQTPFVCTVASGNVTMVATGTCTIIATQSGNASFSATSTSATFSISASTPGAPTIGTATVGNSQLSVSFTPPSSTGGFPIQSYTATCGALSGTGNSSPIAVTGLTNGTPYSCTVSATNQLGTGPSSGVAMGTPSGAAALALVAVHSRKTHGTAGTFDLPIDTSIATIGGNVTVEPRLVLTGHQIVFEFNSAVTSLTGASTVDSAAVVGIGSPMATFAGNEVTVTLTGAVLDNKRLTVQLTGVNGALNTQVNIGFLVGDVTNSRSVTGTDILQTKVRSVSTTDATNFMFDINASGSISGTDILQVKVRSISNLNP